MAGTITVFVALGIALYVCWLMLQPFFNVLLWALVLCVVFYPMHLRIRDRFKAPTTAAAISTILVILLIVLPVTFISITIVHELSGAAAGLQEGMHKFSGANIPGLRWVIERLRPYVVVDPDAAREFLADRVQALGAILATSTLLVVGGAVGAIVQMGLIVFTLFYLFRDADRLRAAILEMLPVRRVQAQDIAARTREVVEATLYGVLAIAAIQGVLGTIIFAILGLPSPLLWGVVMFFMAMIPMAGTFVVWAPAALYLALTGTWLKAIALTVWGVVVIGSIDNLLSPLLVGKRARLHELLIFFAVLGGLQVFGVLGLVLGPVMVAITLALIEMAREPLRTPAPTLTDGGAIEGRSNLRDVS